MKKINPYILFTFLFIVLSNVALAQQAVQVAPQTVSNAASTNTSASTSEDWFGGSRCMEISLEPFLPSCPSTPADYLSGLYKLAVYAGVIAVIIQITIAGIQYATSADNTSKQKEAREQIKDAIIGLVLLLGSVLILRTINPDLVKLNLPGIQPKLSDKQLKEEEDKKIQENLSKLRESCIRDACSKVSSDLSSKCIEVCNKLYSVTIADPEGCFRACCLQNPNTFGGGPPVVADRCYSNGQLTNAGRECAAYCQKSVGD
ncbi:MAG: hypothetical protein ACP5IX_00355 [Patescibacteria group bacterium]